MYYCDAAQKAGISFVRVGNATAVHADVKQYCLSELAKDRFRQSMLCLFITAVQFKGALQFTIHKIRIISVKIQQWSSDDCVGSVVNCVQVFIMKLLFWLLLDQCVLAV